MKVLRNANWGIPNQDLEAMGDAVLADGWVPAEYPTMKSAAELDKLPINSVVRDSTTGAVYRKTTKSSYCWTSAETTGRELSEHLLVRAPMQLIFTPPLL